MNNTKIATITTPVGQYNAKTQPNKRYRGRQEKQVDQAARELSKQGCHASCPATSYPPTQSIIHSAPTLKQQ
ncbi:hypothetical protein E2C01_015439 [Portunus trituberculatus]|uniref:Uncharacterized protein n=1 Tax=Portunus trituberculatus TaxID=210409 RepID=A0A5B7DMK6_PORTR|nr:hypothetical protein [Portunus trituberculatus]